VRRSTCANRHYHAVQYKEYATHLDHHLKDACSRSSDFVARQAAYGDALAAFATQAASMSKLEDGPAATAFLDLHAAAAAIAAEHATSQPHMHRYAPPYTCFCTPATSSRHMATILQQSLTSNLCTCTSAHGLLRAVLQCCSRVQHLCSANEGAAPRDPQPEGHHACAQLRAGAQGAGGGCCQGRAKPPLLAALVRQA
jgi:hypothetical protein